MPGRVRAFWRDVFDLSDRRDTPPRVRAQIRMYLAFGALGVLGYVAADLAWGPTSLTAHLLAIIAPILLATAFGTYLRQRCQRRRRRRRRRQLRGDQVHATARNARRRLGVTEPDQREAPGSPR